MLRVGLLVTVLLMSCRGNKPVESAIDANARGVLDRARARAVSDDVRARFSIKLKGQPSTGGGLIVDRPGRGRLEVFGPLGGPLLTVTSDGTAMAAAVSKGKRHLLAQDAEKVIRETTDGAAGIDDILAVLIGDLPFDEAEVTAAVAAEDGVHVDFIGPSGTKVVAVLDGVTGTPTRLQALDGAGSVLLEATYDPFVAVDNGTLMPTRVDVSVPTLRLAATVRYKVWKVLDDVPEVFATTAPDGFETEMFEEAVQQVIDAAEERAREADQGGPSGG